MTKSYKCIKYKITLLNTVDIQKFVKTLVQGLTGFLKVSVDCWVSTVSYSQRLNDEGVQETQPKYGLVYPNFWGSLNNTEFMRTPEDLEEMIEELDPTLIKQNVLANTFSSARGVSESGVNFHRVLAYEVLVNSYPSGFLLR